MKAKIKYLVSLTIVCSTIYLNLQLPKKIYEGDNKFITTINLEKN